VLHCEIVPPDCCLPVLRDGFPPFLRHELGDHIQQDIDAHPEHAEDYPGCYRVGRDPFASVALGQLYKGDFEKLSPFVSFLHHRRIIDKQARCPGLPFVFRDARPVKGHSDVDLLARAGDPPVRDPYLEEVMSPPDAGFVVLMDKNVITGPGENLSKGVADRLYPLSGLSAYPDRIVQSAPPYLRIKGRPIGAFKLESIGATRHCQAASDKSFMLPVPAGWAKT